MFRFKGCTGGNSCCTQINKCDQEEGDCDHDNDCFKGLKCGHNNCKHKDSLQWDRADDCCYKPGENQFLLITQNAPFLKHKCISVFSE